MQRTLFNRRNIFFYCFIAIFLFAILWIKIFVAFVENLPHPVDTMQGRPTDAIVILTGGNGRINSGIELLHQRMAKKLFITGVGSNASLEEILILSGPLPDDIPTLLAHIELGYQATDTDTNANETAQWIASHGFTSLRLVTSSYHTPRSLAEFQRKMPHTLIIPYPVTTAENTLPPEWWKDRRLKWKLAKEFNKYMMSTFLLWIGL